MDKTTAKEEYSNPTIYEFILTILNKKIPIEKVSLIEENLVGYQIPGFSKSGYVTLFSSNGEIYAKARYDETSKISCFNDLIVLAWDWYIRYKDQPPFEKPDPIWVPFFIEKGWLKKIEKIDYEIVNLTWPNYKS
jgi:hypothetical protein